MEEAWSNHARAIDHHANYIGPRFSQTSVEGLGRRRMGLVDADQTEVARETFDQSADQLEESNRCRRQSPHIRPADMALICG